MPKQSRNSLPPYNRKSCCRSSDAAPLQTLKRSRSTVPPHWPLQSETVFRRRIPCNLETPYTRRYNHRSCCSRRCRVVEELAASATPLQSVEAWLPHTPKQSSKALRRSILPYVGHMFVLCTLNKLFSGSHSFLHLLHRKSAVSEKHKCSIK